MKQIFTIMFSFSFCLLTGGAYHHSYEAIPDMPSITSSGVKDLNMKVFPNPATDFIRIEWNASGHVEIHAELYDLFGRRISQEKADDSASHLNIDLRSFQRSAYLLKVYTADGKFSRTWRIVKY
jgi:hypothetical protein